MITQILCMYHSKHLHTWDESLPYVQYSYFRAMEVSMQRTLTRYGIKKTKTLLTYRLDKEGKQTL